MSKSIDDETDYAHTCCVCGDGLLWGEGVQCERCQRHACKDHAEDTGLGYLCQNCAAKEDATA